MKKLLSLFIITLFTTIVAAQVSKTVNVTTAGILTTLLTATEKSTVTNLTITGEIDARDIKCMRDEITLLTYVDISAVKIQKYHGLSGTISKDTIYKADEMPQYSFFNTTTNVSKVAFQTIILPKDLISIADNAFNSCYYLKNVTISNTVASMGNNAFKGCCRLVDISIPGSVLSIGENIFSGCVLQSVSLSNGLVSIGANAFKGNWVLSSIFIPSTVTSIGANAFSNCTGLTQLSVDSGNANYSSIKGVLFNKDQSTLILFPASQLTSIYSIPASVSTIDKYAFQSCSVLHELTIPNTVKTIGDYAFSWSGLTSIGIPDSVKSIGKYAFWACHSLKNLTLGNGITSIAAYSFAACEKLTGTLSIPVSVISIEDYAFSYCTGLTGITIPNSVKSIGQSAFNNCSGFSNITIPNSVTSIGSGAFIDCAGLTNVVLSNSLKKINSSVFEGCVELKAVTIPNSVTSIGFSAFHDCFSLKTLSIPASVTTIESMAFGCFAPIATAPSELNANKGKQLNQASKITAYNYISSLTDIYLYNPVPVDLINNSEVFHGVNKWSCTLHVCKGSIGAYKSASQWNDFYNIVDDSIVRPVEFAPIGAKWHYSEASFNPNIIGTYQTLESVADTIIDSKKCKKLEVTSRYFGSPQTSYLYFYQHNDSIYKYDGGKFLLLYDFGGIQGDTITLGVQDSKGPMKIAILSNSTININGTVLRTQQIRGGDGFTSDFVGEVIEGIGNLNYIFPITEWSNVSFLRCYEDKIIGSYINPAWGSTDCEKLINGIDTNRMPVISVYPNPTTDKITIISEILHQPCQFELLDVRGSVIKRIELNSEHNSVLLQGFDKGIYLYRISTNGVLLKAGKIVKN